MLTPGVLHVSHTDAGDISCAVAAAAAAAQRNSTQLKNINCKSWQHRRRSLMLRLQIPAECKETCHAGPTPLHMHNSWVLCLSTFYLFIFGSALKKSTGSFRKVATPPTDRYSRFLKRPRDFLHNLKWLFAFFLRWHYLFGSGDSLDFP